ncbi:hypothetical protein DVR12_14395 [Chitinophaga silvatica]|uniref:HEPN domain-containing protein n=1 Tax=Chitinophaga silvatica TaxID=2282649 RepID=A0A3E1Y8V5_9BACT|nr:hypothetical protein [Chitinophaga silvatica]RFS21842.1 hypothetical protein DVR12_14395 [Chitinophaga silvatica]
MGKKLFEKGDNWVTNCLINNSYTTQNTWESYAYGYKLAAEALALKVLQEDNYRDKLIFPIIFLYRHYIELRLKEIIEYGSSLIDKPKKFPKTHALSHLWKDAKIIIIEIWPGSPEERFTEIERAIEAISEIDRQSDAFRYPVDKSGGPSLENITVINLTNFVEIITPIVEILEGIVCGISSYRDDKYDMMEQLWHYFH